jgi:hypothetical protein
MVFVLEDWDIKVLGYFEIRILDVPTNILISHYPNIQIQTAGLHLPSQFSTLEYFRQNPSSLVSNHSPR